MSTKAAPVRVDVATLQGSGPSMQDMVFVTDNAVILLDGATDPDATEHDGGWIADQLGHRLAETLTRDPDVDLRQALADAISSTAQCHGLVPGASPSTTVTVARWAKDGVDVLVLGDSPAVLYQADGSVRVVEDSRLSRLPGRHQFDPAPSEPSAALQRARDLVAYERSLRNRPGGYWIAEADPTAAQHAIVITARRAECTALLLVSDGVADGINRYHEPPSWPDALAIARSGAGHLIRVVHAAEEGDVDRHRWPRSKVHDDKAIAVVTFNPHDDSGP